MAGIKNIQDLYKKVGEKGLREVLEKEVRVTEKFDAYRFAFEKNPHNYKLYFYGKNGKTPLSKIDRTVNDLYEEAIAYIENLPAEVKKSIPVRHRFGFSWFPTNNPLKTSYERRPKGGLVLTDITIRNRDQDVTRDVVETKVFERWSNVFGVEVNKPIFEGKLLDETIESLIHIAKAETGLSMLNESQVSTLGLLNTQNANIEALVFESENLLFKVSEALEEAQKKEKRGHLFDILLMNICEYLSDVNINNFKPASMHVDEAYIEIVSDIFNDFVEKRGTDFLASELERPRFLEKSGSFNRNWIKNPKTLMIIENNKKYEYLLTVFLTNLRKPKYPSGLLSEAVVNNFNSKIEDIAKVVSDDFSFLEFSTILRESDEPETKKTVEDTRPDIAKSVVLLHNFFGREVKEKEKEPVEVILCNCAFITNRLVNEAKSIFQKSGKRIIIIHDIKYDAYRVNEETIEKMLSDLCKKHHDLFIGYYILHIPTLSHLLKKCGEFYPKELYCLPSKEGMLQMDYSGLSATHCGNFHPFEISKLPLRIYDECLESLEKDDIFEFKKVMPDFIHAYWTELKNAFDRKTYY